MTARKLAHDLLQGIEKNKQFSNIALDRALESTDMQREDKALVSALVYGVIERKITLDYYISVLSAKPVGDLDLSVLTAIRLGLYQLIYMDRIPPHAAINESVNLVSRRASGFVNAILRSYLRKPDIALPKKDDDISEYLSVKYSVGLPLVKRLAESFGDTEAEAILAGFEGKTETTIAVNTLRISREELSSHIDGARPTRYSQNGLQLHGSVRELYGFDDGLFYVQDEASQICVEALDARPDMRLLDICSCPGSKSFGAAISMEDRGEIFAFDLHKKKLPLIESGAQRLGINIIKTSACDGRVFLPEFEATADRVLCDVPCSGFGVLAKKPELRYKDPEESSALPDIQLAILENACRYVKSGGLLVYSTCTILPEENEKNIFRFLDKHPEFSLVPFKVGDLNFDRGYMTLFPHIHKTDGFFIARLLKS